MMGVGRNLPDLRVGLDKFNLPPYKALITLTPYRGLYKWL